MIWKVQRSVLNGSISVPPSKSHTVRALLVATLAKGKSVIRGALVDGDGASALAAARGLGARCDLRGDSLLVAGTAGELAGGSDTLYLGNSGASTRMFAAAAALGARERTFDGDASLRTRPMKPLLESLKDLGATCTNAGGPGDVPFTIRGPMTGGETTIEGITSQFVSSLLLACPLAKGDSTIHVENLHEKPYIDLTRWWLDRMGVRYSVNDDYTCFAVPGGQSYVGLDLRIPGDFSSATFGAVGAVLTRSSVILRNLDFTDPQGDKGVFAVLGRMGAAVDLGDGGVTVTGSGPLVGREIDLNGMPDALPALAVLGCAAEGATILTNVAQARIKETDRIAVLASELSKMGARVEERDDGLVIHQSRLAGSRVNGHHDHRIVMALALAGMVADGETIIETAEAAAVTYPSFVRDFGSLGAAIEVVAQGSEKERK